MDTSTYAFLPRTMTRSSIYAHFLCVGVFYDFLQMDCTLFLSLFLGILSFLVAVIAGGAFPCDTF